MPNRPDLNVLFGVAGRPIDGRVLELLRQIRELGSLAAAAGKTRISYRHAWGELGRLAAALGGPAVELQRGRGAELTPAGVALLALHQSLTDTVAAAWPGLAAAAMPAARAAPATAPLRIQASHDYALASLRDLAMAQGLAVELHIQGSEDALQSLADGNCELAGFHIASSPAAVAGLGRLARLLRGRTMRIIEIATRRQGLMMPRNQAGHVSSIADLARGDVNFVNRQPGSGTRLLLDRMLEAEGIATADIRGYRDEEFTHGAVAATVASGRADVGFGIEAAARLQGLDFVRLATERYLLAMCAATLTAPAMRVLCELLNGPEFSRVLARLPGYSAPATHAPQRVADAFSDTPAAFR